METFSIEYFENNFDELFNRVENGESFVIESKNGKVMVSPFNSTSSEMDDFIRIHTDHEEGC